MAGTANRTRSCSRSSTATPAPSETGSRKLLRPVREVKHQAAIRPRPLEVGAGLLVLCAGALACGHERPEARHSARMDRAGALKNDCLAAGFAVGEQQQAAG